MMSTLLTALTFFIGARVCTSVESPIGRVTFYSHFDQPPRLGYYWKDVTEYDDNLGGAKDKSGELTDITGKVGWLEFYQTNWKRSIEWSAGKGKPMYKCDFWLTEDSREWPLEWSLDKEEVRGENDAGGKTDMLMHECQKHDELVLSNPTDFERPLQVTFFGSTKNFTDVISATDKTDDGKKLDKIKALTPTDYLPIAGFQYNQPRQWGESFEYKWHSTDKYYGGKELISHCYFNITRDPLVSEIHLSSSFELLDLKNSGNSVSPEDRKKFEEDKAVVGACGYMEM